jgi:hypothetical protein
MATAREPPPDARGQGLGVLGAGAGGLLENHLKICLQRTPVAKGARLESLDDGRIEITDQHLCHACPPFFPE